MKRHTTLPSNTQQTQWFIYDSTCPILRQRLSLTYLTLPLPSNPFIIPVSLNYNLLGSSSTPFPFILNLNPMRFSSVAILASVAVIVLAAPVPLEVSGAEVSNVAEVASAKIEQYTGDEAKTVGCKRDWFGCFKAPKADKYTALTPGQQAISTMQDKIADLPSESYREVGEQYLELLGDVDGVASYLQPVNAFGPINTRSQAFVEQSVQAIQQAIGEPISWEVTGDYLQDYPQLVASFNGLSIDQLQNNVLPKMTVFKEYVRTLPGITWQ